MPRAPVAAVARPPRARASRRSAAGAIEAQDTEAADVADPDAAAALDALRRIVRELRVTAANAESETGLSAAQLFVLHQVGAAPGLSLTEIATRTLTDRTSVAAVVDRLLAQALVARRAGAVDRRRAEIFVTRAGARVLARAPHPPTRLVLDAMTTMSVRERRQLARSLGHLARAMGLSGADAPMLFEDVARAR